MSKPKAKVVLVFGENDNDRSALVEIARALAPDAGVRYEKRNKPLILLPQRERAETVRSTVSDITNLVKAAQVRFDVVAIIAHRDCDAVEPAHIAEAASIEAALRAVGVKHIVAATPAFELEAWWLLYPEAVRAVCPSWQHFSYAGANVGLITNAKEYLARILRPKSSKKKGKCPDYSESDSIRIARQIREQGIIRRVQPHQSGSLVDFIKRYDTVFAEGEK